MDPEGEAGVIDVAGLTMRYGSVTALDSLDVTVPRGVTGLVGSNGAGKSTLIRILLGLLRPSAGSGRVLGMDVATQGPAIRARVGYMPEHECLPPDVKGAEFVVHMGRVSGLPADVARERAADTLRHVGLFEARYRPIGEYSTGMRQRVRLAQALVHDPDLVLLDEPTNGLDPQGRDEMLSLVRRIGTEFGISVVVTSHLLGELERISDHVVIIDAGRLVRSQSTATALQSAGVLQVRVLGRAGAVADELSARGWVVREVGDRRRGDELEITLDGEHAAERAADDVRDVVAGLGEGLVSMHGRRHRLSELVTAGDR